MLTFPTLLRSNSIILPGSSFTQIPVTSAGAGAAGVQEIGVCLKCRGVLLGVI